MTFVKLSLFSLSKSSKKADKQEDDSNSYCDAFKYSPMSDANYTTYGNVMLSFTTATGEEVSRLKTIMHELGHSVSKAISDDPQIAQQMYGVRKCLADQHTEELPAETKKYFDEARKSDPKFGGSYVEEDFADTIAEESGKVVKGRNSWCQFLTLSSDRQQYEESSIQADDGDTHSSSLFRLLNFEMMKKGNVPDSCKRYYTAIKFTDQFKSCIDLANPQGSSQSSPTRAVQ